MSDIAALFRVSLARHRWLLIVMLGAGTIGVLLSLLSILIAPGDLGAQTATVSLFLTLMPAGIASIVLFDYGLDGDLSAAQSSCGDWMLRMPIRSWKIAIVPVVLKTAWISGIWLIFHFAAGLLGADSIPLIMPCVVFSAISIWLMVVSWRPCRSSFSRLVGLAIAGPILYCALIAVFMAPTMHPVEWRFSATVASWISGITLYLAGVWAIIRATELARVNPGGIVPAESSSRRFASITGAQADSQADLSERTYRSPLHALIHHDYLRSRDWIRWIFVFAIVPAIIIFTLFLPLSLPTVVLAFFLFPYLAGFVVSRSTASTDSSAMLQPYIAVSPLSTKTLAWPRQLFPLALAFATYLCILFAFLGWACWESNREVWMRWAEAQAVSLDRPGDAMSVGVRISTACVLGVAVFFLSRIGAFLWVSLAGRTWVTSVAIIASSLAGLCALGAVLTWFLQQTDWDSTRESALSYLRLLPFIVGGLLVMKAALSAAVSAHAIRKDHITLTDAITVTLVWTILASAFGVLLFLLIPNRIATLGWCLAFTALTIPLARILLLPTALSWNRHR